MADPVPVKRRGRPPKDPSDRKDGNLTFRTRGSLRAQLAEAAKRSGRSISEEVEQRLERSFYEPELIEAVQSATRTNTMDFFEAFRASSVGGYYNARIGDHCGLILENLRHDNKLPGDDDPDIRGKIARLLEEKGASVFVPALVATLPSPPVRPAK